MVARLLYGSPIDDEVNRLTAEDVLNHELDISGALNFADKIRSKEFSAKEVARVLRKRLDSSNPNVQILVLSLADICVKNGGSLIQLEISGREFIDEVANLLESKTGRDFELRQLVLKLIQEWAALFRGNIEMGYASGVFERMKRSGYSFPKLDVMASGAMVDTASAPEWEDSAVCQRCRTGFTFTNRKHHCRHCGKCFCNDCSSNTTPIPKFAIYDPVRVCHGCYLRLKKIVPDSDSVPTAVQSQASTSRPAAATATFSSPNINDDDEDLKRAIELSLQESQARPNYADYTLQGRPSSAAQYSAPAPAAAPAPAPAFAAQASTTRYPAVSSEPFPLTSATANEPDADEDDPDLRAAIEASLRDIPENSVPDYLGVPAGRRYSAQAPVDMQAGEEEENAVLSAFMPSGDVGSDDESGPLTATEWENVHLFEALLLRIRDSGQDIRNDSQVQYLHENIEQLRPRITGAIDGVEHKHKEFVKLHDRIITAIKIYDQLLDKRLRSNTYLSVGSSAQNAMPSVHPAPQSMYPAVPAQQATYSPAPQPPFQPWASSQYVQPGQSSASAQQRPPQQLDQNLPPPSNYQAPLGPHSIQGDSQPRQSVYGSSQQQQQPAQLSQPSHAVSSATPVPAQPQYSAPFVAEPVRFFQQAAPSVATYPPAHEMSHSPPTNPNFVPPPVTHVPSFPVLQPAFKTSTQAAQPTPPATAPAAVSAAEPEEEAPLIEF
ncbi:Vacuolar protein-sorting-associated protein 27 [Coemansia thaxteri]|uniref:Vacuolar protein sorting-associated protein 27 n=1 Tax=Coemansia thaxteri TaxID=2663907 RepID=A0A9W8BF66_9FUNG|nr:Vacuolar protein-sorting-associated protein 27 [Coemansia thaxteri]KAJ2484578.1 Vacuolar protein-sorting-associated protein 27 [Coemansia sp. RSA 2320]